MGVELFLPVRMLVISPALNLLPPCNYSKPLQEGAAPIMGPVRGVVMCPRPAHQSNYLHVG
jgi:hypothetical protein